MTNDYTVAAGLDVHKKFIQATILWKSGTKIQQQFNRTTQGILALRDWILDYKCDVVACESTSDYWVTIYDELSKYVPMIVGNAHDIKVLAHKKTDKIDSEMIALLALNKMIPPSRVMSKPHRDFRKILRMRHFLVRKRTDVKNRIHSILDGELFHLSQILTDIFGMSGQYIMQGILKGASADDILTLIHSRIRAKSETKLRALLAQDLSPSALMQLGLCLKIIKVYDEQIKELTKAAQSYVLKNYPREYQILRSVPGIGDIGAITLIAEIGDFKDFESGDKLASWIGLVPKVYQSANHTINRSITKRGPRLARWIMTQIAHAVTRCRETVLKDWYEAKKNMIGTGKAIIGLARKMITIIWHIVVNDELYVEKDSEGKEKEPKKVHTIRIPTSPDYTLEQIVAIISDAITTLNKRDPDPS